MKPHTLIPTTFAVLALATHALAQSQQPTEAEKVSKAQAAAYVTAFNRGEAKAIAAMYAEDAQYTNDDGETVVGRAAVRENLEKYFAKNKGVKLEVQIESARFLTPDVLIEKGLATVADETTRYICNYVRKDGAWLISELNETTLPPANAGAVALDELSWLIGSWKDNAPGVTVTTSVAWTKNRHFLRRSITVTREGEEEMEATEIIGYDPVAGGIRSWVFDSEGGFGEGAWTRDENKWLVAFKGTAPDGATSTAQHVITYLDEKKYTWESISRQREGEVLPNLDKIEVVRTAAE